MNFQAVKTEYKTFTAPLETPTLLDEFAPIFIEEIAHKFEPIKGIKTDYCNRLQYYATTLRSYQGFENTSKIFLSSAQQMNQIFDDFQKRMKYFTLVFFGAVSSGKTSMICDLANMNPHKLTEIISSQANFDPKKDGISIGPNVATINLYEILIEKSCIRLVDVPGIGGVVHDNSSLAPFVDMADCVIFLLDANSDITKNDYDFIYDHVASMTESKAEKGLDKKALVVINKWRTLTASGRTIAVVQKDLETKKKWILDGDEHGSFSGIAGLFSKRPEIVISNTSGRDDQTGERYPGWEELLDMNQVVNTLRDILQEEGAILRLNRPRQILLKEISRICTELETEKTGRSVDDLIEELNRLGFRIDSVSNNMQVQFDARLNNLMNVISMTLAPQIKRVLNNWKPQVGFVNQMKLIVPEWVPGVKGSSMGKTAVQNTLKEEWETELRDLIKQGVDFGKIKAIVQQEAGTLSSLISSTYRLELSGANPQLLQKLSAFTASVSTGSIGDSTVSLNNAINSAVKKIESEVLKDILTILTFDAVLAALAGAFLTPVGSALLVALRRWLKGDKKQREIKQELEYAVDEAVNIAASNIRDQIASRVRQGIEEAVQNIRSILNQEQQNLSKPMIVIDQAIADLNTFRSKLESLSLK